MSQIQHISIQLEGIGSVLKGKRFKVPAYQRSYAWEKEHVESLLNDINDAIKNKEREYFLGSIVVTAGDNNRYDVVDGQQRLTTVSLIIAAIKDIFKNEDDREVVLSVKSDFLASTDRKTKEQEPKLVLNEVDNEVYQELIDDIDNIDDSKYRRQSHKRLIEASKSCILFLEKIRQQSKDSEEELHEWLDYIETNLKIIVVVAPDDSNAFTIFETLNDRGLELAISDLLKNYLFHRSGEKLEETKNRWQTMVSILESASDDPLVVTYLRHFSMAKYGLIREKELFSVIKKKITSKKLALTYSNNLADGARVYSALINTDHEFWSSYDYQVTEAVSALNLLGMIQIRPLLLAVLEKFDNKNVKIIFKKLVSVAVRFQIVGGVGGGTLEKLYADTARSISEGKINLPVDVISAFKNLPSDSEFRTAFSVATISKQKLARFYLRYLENGYETDSEKVPSLDTDRVNLEHVLPSNPTSEWTANFKPDELRAYQNRLGNLALMSSKMNSTIGNCSFSDKKELYRKSSFNLTKSISEEGVWNKQAIENRQSIMADLAVKIWSV
ncbi:MAG: DUF262 domain-containing protein [Chitinophaga sp.]|uniref:DUF262 domain-containing protein n=1 Tax=Flavobacterium sp. TaxID=239 RepID=UPI0025C52FCA|nr:DUF262 domain-containing HNH endonuclease family protein [Flavobacterium sp.]MBA4155687.1 DUF262 domain-containing protein [Flavobacterium sp.]MBA4260305.1 DUF262 domain-containing protein [Chitinophaga sp.]